MADQNWLKEYGFNALQLPRRDLSPLDVLLKDNGRLDNKVGTLAMVFDPSGPPPTVSPGEPVSDINRVVSRSIDIKLGTKILSALFGSGGRLGADLEGKKATSLTVTYEDVIQDSVAVLELQSWIEAATPKLTGRGAVWLNDDRLAAVSAVLRSKKLAVVAKKESGASLDLSVPEIKGIVSGSGDVSVEATSSSQVTFTGTTPVTFGIQAYIMNFEGNRPFGIEPVRRPAVTGQDYSGFAWTEDEEIDDLGNQPLPVG